MILTLFDWLLIASALAAVFNAVQNGLGKEMLHTFLLLGCIVAGVLFFKDAATPSLDGPAMAAKFINFGFYLIMLYVLLWVVIRTIGGMFIGNYYGGYRSKFWGGVLALAKLITLGLGVMLAYAVASPLPTPERIMQLPQALSSSAFVNFGDVEAELMYQWLGRNGWVNTDKKPTTTPTAVSPTTPLPISATVPSPTTP